MANTLASAQERFAEAQARALQAGDEYGELIAIGLQELTAALRSKLSKLDDLERNLRNVESSVRQLR